MCEFIVIPRIFTQFFSLCRLKHRNMDDDNEKSVRGKPNPYKKLKNKYQMKQSLYLASAMH